MRWKKLILAILIIVIYCLLLILLTAAESAYSPAPGVETQETISTFPQALWYSLTTLTTVGYGDLVPHTVVGRIIGTVFLLLSVGSLVVLLTAMLSTMRERIFPRIRLMLASDKEWYVFSEETPRSSALAKNLIRASDKNLCIFAGQGESNGRRNKAEGMSVAFSVEELARMKKDNISVIYMGDNGYQNYQDALTDKSARIYCMTEYEPDTITDRITFFHPYPCCARLYWKRYPVLKEDETVALIGGGKYAAAILEQALLLNVFSPRQHLTYLIYGDPAGFSKDHPYLSDIFSVDRSDQERDSLFFLSDEWYSDPERLRKADRIIVCPDSEEEALETLHRINRSFPISGTVYARLSTPFGSAVIFGGTDEIFTPELVLRSELDKAAKALNEIYRANMGGNAPSWEELGGFLRRSNLACADHLDVMARILLGSDGENTPYRERMALAYKKYLERKEKDAELFREIEHDRWMRFHILNNWRYAPVRDNAQRLHPLMAPFDSLPEAERAKDDYAWELLGTAAEADI